MGNSTQSLESLFDRIASEAVPDPRLNASGFGDILALGCSNDTMADLITERFNWKFNSAVARPFLTNSWQQDYPQLAQPRGIIGWGEICDSVDINSTSSPKTIWHPSWRRQLPTTSTSVWRPEEICWMYNQDMSLGFWPGAGVVYSPLLGINAPATQNPIMSMLDKNNNILIVTGFGTTGSAAPFAAPNADEGVTVTDNTVTWTVVSPTSQGFRLDSLPNATGPTWQMVPTYQLEPPPPFTDLSALINPIPDSYSRHFYRGLKAACLMASPNPNDKDRGKDAKIDWLNSMPQAIKQGDKELNAFALLPASSVVEPRWGENRPFSANDPR